MSKYKRVVSVGAHPLDAELIGGPIMIRHQKHGAKCTMIHLTTGRLEDPNATEEEKQAYSKQIQDEIENAAKEMGCDSYPMNYISSEMPTTAQFIDILVDYFTKEEVDLVITHCRGTLHPRHYYSYETVTEAVKKMRLNGSNIDLLYGENCEDLVGFIPTKYIMMSDEEKDIWFKGLSQYEIFNGKVNDVPYIDYYNSIGIIRAIEAGTHGFAKAYMHAGLIYEE